MLSVTILIVITTSVVMLSGIILPQCRYYECHQMSVVVLSNVMLSVVILNVIKIISVVTLSVTIINGITMSVVDSECCYFECRYD
jgi:hypothetical protein